MPRLALLPRRLTDCAPLPRPQLVKQHVGHDVVDKRVYIALLMVPLQPLCQLRRLKQLVPCSFIANTCIVAGLLITMYYVFRDLPDPSGRRYGVESIQGMPIFFSTALFAMEGIGSVSARSALSREGWRFQSEESESCALSR